MKKYFYFPIRLKDIQEFCKTHKLLVIILFLGFILRILPILWGVPLTPFIKSYHPDEPKVYFDIMNFPRSYFSFEQFKGYGTFIQNAFGFLFIPLKLIKLFGSQNLYEITIIILARFFIVIIGTAAILFTYLLAAKIFNKNTALVAAAMFAVSFYPVINSSVITLDVAMSLLIIINFQLSFYAIKTNELKSYIILGIAGGILLGTKITGGLFLLIPVVLNLIYIRGSSYEDLPNRNFTSQTIRNLIVYLSVAVFIFLLFNSYVYLYPGRYINFLIDQKENLVDRSFVSIWQIPFTWIKATNISTGIPITLLFVIGLVGMRKKNLNMQLVLFLFLFEYYMFWRWSILPRYIISVAPLICIFAANALIYLYEKKNSIIKGIAIGAFVFTIIYSGYLCFSGILLRFTDTRTEASRYIDKNIKEGSSIGNSYTAEKFSGKYHGWRYPKINYNKYKDESFLDKPDVIILSSYDFNQVNRLLNSNELNDMYELNKKYYREWYRYSPPSPQVIKRFDELLNQKNDDYVLIKTFKKEINVTIEFPPPEIRIYKKNKKM